MEFFFSKKKQTFFIGQNSKNLTDQFFKQNFATNWICTHHVKCHVKTLRIYLLKLRDDQGLQKRIQAAAAAAASIVRNNFKRQIKMVFSSFITN